MSSESEAEIHHGELLDIASPKYVDIEIRQDGKVVWVNVDGITRIRLCRIENLYITDNRPERKRRGTKP